MMDRWLLPRLSCYALFVLGLNGLWLLSPPPTEPFYGYWLPLSSWLGVPRNWDSEEFRDLAARPAQLLDPACKRQSRPLSVWLASAAAHPFNSSQWRGISACDVAYVGQNLILLTGALVLFLHLCRRQQVPALVMWGLAVPLICNDLTKAFFWNNHQQMFAVFTPLFLIWMCVVLWERTTVLRCLGFSSLAGILFLGYGTWMLAPPLILGIVTLKLAFSHIARRQAIACVGVVLVFVLPIALWMGYVIARNGHFYSAEISLVHQFVWLRDAWSHGVLYALHACADYAWQFGRTFKSWQLLPFVMLAAAICSVHYRRLSTVGMASLIVAALFALFLYLMGYYRIRLTFSLVPPLLVLVAPFLGHWRWSSARLWLLNVAWVAHHVLKSGPYD